MSDITEPVEVKKDHVVKVCLTHDHAAAFKALTRDLGSDMSTFTRQLIIRALREAQAA